MDQRSGELEQNEEETAIKSKAAAYAGLRPATSSDVRDSEREIIADLQKIEEGSSETAAETEQIKEQIEQTRSQMSETIDAIQEKLSFSNISEQVSSISEQVKEQVSEHITNAVDSAKDAVYDATIGKAENIMQTVTKGLNNVSESMGEAGSYVVSSARRNPVPLALIGLGIGMLVVQSRSKPSYSTGKHKNANQQGDSQTVSTFRQVADTTTGALSSAQKAVGTAAGSAYAGVGTAASSAYSGVSSAAGSAYEGVAGFASSTGEQVQLVARKAQNQYEQTLEDNPLAIGAIALAIGAIVGLSIPSTQYENQLLGESRESLVQSVEGAARGAFEKAQEVVGEVTKTVQEQAKAQG